MFGRIMAVVVAVIVLLTSVLSGLGLYTLTSRQTAIRQENLRAEAREIAYLASLYSGGSSTYTLGTSLFSGSAQNTVALKHLRWKAAQVYDEYGAYIAIVDRSGQVMDNMAVTYEKNPDFAKTINGKDIYGLREVLYLNSEGMAIFCQLLFARRAIQPDRFTYAKD